MAEEFKDLSEVEFGSEPIETEDFAQASRSLIPPRIYISPYRRILARQADDKVNVTFQVEFSGGINDGNGHNYQYVPRTWLSTVTWTPRNGKGKTSSVAQYLKAFGLPTSLTGKALLSAIAETQDKPVGVEIGLEDDPQERAKVPHKRTPGRMVPGKRRAYTREFNKGTRENPIYVDNIEKDGATLKAREVVEGFHRA